MIRFEIQSTVRDAPDLQPGQVRIIGRYIDVEYEDYIDDVVIPGRKAQRSIVQKRGPLLTRVISIPNDIKDNDRNTILGFFNSTKPTRL